MHCVARRFRCLEFDRTLWFKIYMLDNSRFTTQPAYVGIDTLIRSNTLLEVLIW